MKRPSSQTRQAPAGQPRIFGRAYRRPGHPGHTRGASRLMTLLGRCFGTLMYRVEVEGLEHLPESGPTLVLVKHQRNEDIPLGFAYVLGRRRSDNWCIMKHNLAAPLFLGFFLKAGGVPINRERPMRSRGHLRLARELLHDGRLLVVFPEQTFFANEMGPGKLPGFRYLTRRAPTPVQVVSVGFEYIAPRRFGRTRAVLRLAPPRCLEPSQTCHERRQADFLHDCMNEIARLTGLDYPHPPAWRKSAGPSRLANLRSGQ